MADVVAERAGRRRVLVQDYHFSLLGRMLAEARPDLRTVHFSTRRSPARHARLLPDDVVAELLDGMAGSGPAASTPPLGGLLPGRTPPPARDRRRPTFVARSGPMPACRG